MISISENHERDRIVIVGNGHAGVQVADSLRTDGYQGELVLLGEETRVPYQRPPLSKDYMEAGSTPEPLPLRGPRFFAEKEIDHRTGSSAVGIDRAARNVALADGSRLSYTSLVLATGGRNRSLSIPGAELDGIHGLRTLDDAQALHARLDQAPSIVVVGAGFIGLEFAAATRARGLDVTVLEHANRPMGRVLSPLLADYFADAHRADGMLLRLGEGVAAFHGNDDGRVVAVESTTGELYAADLVITGVGIAPRTELARESGLTVDNGIVVDAALRTIDPAIYVIGDCANHPNRHAGTRTRLESVQNATDQARHVAGAILGRSGDYVHVPWFWSHQGHLKLQIAGISATGDETVVRGNPAKGRFSVFCFRNGTLSAVESLNRPADHMAARRLLAQDRRLTPEEASNPGFDLKAHTSP